MQRLRSRGIRLIVFLDDFLIVSHTKEGAERDFRTAAELLERCGFVVNYDKSVSLGSTSIEYLGLRVDSLMMAVQLKQKKFEEIQVLCDSPSLRAFIS